MQCPFLRKMNVKFCGLCRSTMIPMNQGNAAADLCSGPGYLDCPLVREHPPLGGPQDHCPHLSVGDVHFCSVAPFQKLIPCNRTTASRCTDDGHKYCQTYLNMVGAGQLEGTAAAATPPPGHTSGTELDLPLPEALAYAPNHLWLDLGDGPTCHVGVDAFVGRALGHIDEVIYPHLGDSRRPLARLRSAGVDFDLVFPNTMLAWDINPHLATDPGAALSDPYGRGWLFEGVSLPGRAQDGPHPLEKGLIRGPAARSWMREECDRLACFAHDHLREHDTSTGLLMQDGGAPLGHLAAALDRPALIRLHHEFFSLRHGRTES